MHIMMVSPSVFSEMQVKALDNEIRRFLYPDSEEFALWAIETFGCMAGVEYQIVVKWEWGTLRKWEFDADSEGKQGEVSEGLAGDQ